MEIVINILEKYLKKRDSRGIRASVFKGCDNSIRFGYNSDSMCCYIDTSDFEEILEINGIIEKIREKNKYPNYTKNYEKIIEELIYNCLADYVYQYLRLAGGVFNKNLIPIKKHKNDWK